jgi:threonine aldolase
VTKDFRSDNVLPASPEIAEAVLRANAGAMTSYGGDEVTARVRERCSALFETEVKVFPIITGIAGNAMALASMTPASGAVLCHDEAHIEREELGATTFFSGGAAMVPILGAHGKLQPEAVAEAIAANPRATTLSITNATEAGTVYAPDELRALCDVARGAGLRVHFDGARFANAVAATGASPAELSWRAGADALSFGATKNGAMCADVVVAFAKDLHEPLATLWHRSGHRPSKMRFLSAQLEAYLTDDLWLRNARHANAMGTRLAAALRGVVEVVQPVEANIVFAKFRPPLAAALKAEGYRFFDWDLFGKDVYRLVCGFATTEEDVDGFAAAVRSLR